MVANGLIQFEKIVGQDRAIGFLRRVCLSDRLPHALLFAGPAGVGKATTAMALAAWFLCQKPDRDRPCGRCESCRVFPSGNHPDHHVITKELIRYYDETGKSKAVELSIKVIRPELIEKAAHTASLGRGKFFVVEQAELMSTAAQNAMLKTLEEPAGRSVIVLLTDSPHSLLSTILSRCQLVPFGPLDNSLVVDRLKAEGLEAKTASEAAELSGGSIGAAMRLISEGTLASAREAAEQIDQFFTGRAPPDFAGWLAKAAGAYAEKQLERDPLASKESATRAGLGLFSALIAERFRRRLYAAKDGEDRQRICAGIDAIARCQMYMDANVNVAVALGQLVAAWTEEFAGQA
jgi:DNA polymerase III subunit delta'